ncbi:MAG: folate-binding protein YgfZ [Rhodocyclaceae bacterium]|jgi:folate-binding protein YgfZ|nr:folate-binding protein YgfZ [Rhodocyclaceae bacterium]MCC6879252.1 folate-binding protein YgfZ [Rhodocyclaceae bacterium]MCL4681186.1 folate-binding protein YgfZ [Rhodocyclaceae bacterium]
MNSNWQNFLTSRGAHFVGEHAIDFGDAKAELEAAASATVLSALTQFSLIRATGEDAASFLHNLLTNDVQHLGRNRAERCGFCSPKGRLLADFLLWREDNDYLLQLSADIQPAMLKKLGMYVLRSKVKLSDAGNDVALLGLSGSEAPAALKAAGIDAPAAPFDVTHFADGAVIRLDAHRFQLAVRAEAAAGIWERLSALAKPVGVPSWRWLEIAAGIPHITASIQEEFVPQMANLELIGGVSFTKGCYPGQEVVARTKYLGKVKRRTYRGHLLTDCPPAGADLFSPDLADQSCGKVIDSAPAPSGGCEVLASMLMSSAETGEVRVGSADGPRLTFLALPYALE